MRAAVEAPHARRVVVRAGDDVLAIGSDNLPSRAVSTRSLSDHSQLIVWETPVRCTATAVALRACC
eukprot:785250-Pleurochrysis_carterae.AAC.1